MVKLSPRRRRSDSLESSNDHRFPINAVEYCLREGRVSPTDLDYVGFYDKPLAKFDRLIETYVAFAPHSFRSWIKALPLWLKSKLHLQREMDRAFRDAYRGVTGVSCAPFGS
jgi:carbamoyltransferase